VEIDFPIYLSPLVVDFIGRLLNRDPAKRMSLEEVERHEWMKKYENESGRMISKDIWDCWMKLSKGE
jgi:serine/threonine protein kinase